MMRSSKFSPEVRERAVKMVLENQGEYESQWGAIVSVAAKIGCTGETLRGWNRRDVQRADIDAVGFELGGHFATSSERMVKPPEMTSTDGKRPKQVSQSRSMAPLQR